MHAHSRVAALLGAALLIAACQPTQLLRRRVLGPDERPDRPDEDFGKEKQLFFGDLAVRTQGSFENLVLHRSRRGVGAACDFAQRCSGLDFIAVTDDAEGMSALDWSSQRDAINACNDTALKKSGGAPGDEAPFVAYLGFTWNGVHDDAGWGRKRVIFRNSAVPDKPIGAPLPEGIKPGALVQAPEPWRGFGVAAAKALPEDRGFKPGYLKRLQQLTDTDCSVDAVAPTVGPVCRDVAEDPKALFDSLRRLRSDRRYGDRGYDVIAIAAETTAAGLARNPTRWDRQLTPEQLGLDIQVAAEIYGGSGNAESPGASAECEDCFRPAYGHTEGARGALQLGLAATGHAPEKELLVARLGFTGGSGTREARPGAVAADPEAAEPWDDAVRKLAEAGTAGMSSELLGALDARRYPGGLTAVWAPERTRRSIFRALRRREIYSTTGARIELRFRASSSFGESPMGGYLRAAASDAPRLKILARGAPRLDKNMGDEDCSPACSGLCYKEAASAASAASRNRLARVEIVRIRHPRVDVDGDGLGDEALFTDFEGGPCGGPLIQDPWKVFENSDNDGEMEIELLDPDLGRCPRYPSAAYYVRVLQAPSPAATAAGKAKAPQQERAWSSPIWIEVR